MRYVVKNLSEVADAFGKRAESSQRWAENAKSATERKTAEVEARTWQAAEQWLRDTEIVP